MMKKEMTMKMMKMGLKTELSTKMGMSTSIHIETVANSRWTSNGLSVVNNYNRILCVSEATNTPPVLVYQYILCSHCCPIGVCTYVFTHSYEQAAKPSLSVPSR